MAGRYQYEEQLEQDKPFIETIGTETVNTGLLLLYASFWIWGWVTLFSVPSNPNVSWPLSLALAFVLSSSVSHFAVIGIGSTLVPGFVFYPVKPRWLYMANDGLIGLCFLGILISYIINAQSSTVPLFTTFLMIIALSIMLWKVVGLMFGWHATAEPASEEGYYESDVGASAARKKVKGVVVRK